MPAMLEVNGLTKHFPITRGFPKRTVGWLTVDCSQVEDSGIVSVTLNLGSQGDLDPTTSSATCKPATFCARPESGPQECKASTVAQRSTR